MPEPVSLADLAAMEAWVDDLDLDTLESSPSGYTARLIDDRSAGQHPCLRCGGAARVAYILERHRNTAVQPPRWVDLCPPCARLLRQMFDAVDRREVASWSTL